ncbi:hypothetical protein R6Q59_036203 [Mikania micrantha]
MDGTEGFLGRKRREPKDFRTKYYYIDTSERKKQGGPGHPRALQILRQWLPLALKVLGSFLYDKTKDGWVSTLDRLKDIPEDAILDQLKISYDGLKNVEKELFLDIACFFRWSKKYDKMEMFEACDFHPEIGIEVLRQKALISIVDGWFHMHDLVQEMGHYIVRREYPNNPDKQQNLETKRD